MNVSSDGVPYEERLKQVLLEVAAIATETKKPVPVTNIIPLMEGIAPATVYSRALACVKMGWLNRTRDKYGFISYYPTIEGYRVVGETPPPSKEVKEPQEGPEFIEEEFVYSVGVITENNEQGSYFISKKSFKEILNLLKELDGVTSMHVKRERLV